jgi:hypothetical protein
MESRVLQARRHILAAIRQGLRPGSPISVKETAAFLRISPTPVREALERLVGEGAVTIAADRTGFEMPRFTSREVAGLHELVGLLLKALNRGSARSSAKPPPTIEVGAADVTIENILDTQFRTSNNPVLISALKRTVMPLATYRRVEPIVIPNWAMGVGQLHAALADDTDVACSVIADFTAVRIAAAPALVAAVDDLQDQSCR